MSTLTVETLDQGFRDYPYWVLATALAKNLGEQSLIEYPTFPQHDRYRELSWRNTYYEDDLNDFIPLTPIEREEYRELQRLNSIYSNKLNELHSKTMVALKTVMMSFGIVPPKNINPKLLTMGEKTLEAWKSLLHSSCQTTKEENSDGT